MKKQIVIDEDCRGFLIKAFKCSRMAVWRAMNFVNDSDMSRRMRRLALQRGGELVGDKVEPETSFEEVEHTMTQHFGERVKLVCCRITNIVTVYVDGKVERKVEGLNIPQLMELQKEVSLLAASL